MPVFQPSPMYPRSECHTQRCPALPARAPGSPGGRDPRAPRGLLAAAVAAVILCLALNAAGLPSQGADEEEKLEQFLARLGLVDLQILHLEQRLDQPLDTTRRGALAARLADLYAAQLIAASGDAAKYEDLLRRMDQLVQKVPQAKTASLEVMLLQADYHRAEGLMVKWLDAPSDTNSREEAEKILERIAPQLEQRHKELQAAAERLADQVDKMSAGEERDVKETELSRLRSVAGRAAYFAAWSNYYRARADLANPRAQGALAAARSLFQSLLGIGNDYRDLQPDFLGLESLWRSRAVIGLGLAEAAAGNLDHSGACFDMLRHATVPPEIRDLAPYWRLEALLSAQRYEEALAFAKQQAPEFSATASQGKVSFYAALIRAAYARPEAPLPQAQEMGRLGLIGLARMGRMSAVRDLAAKYHIPLDAGQDFHLRWIAGQQWLEKAEKTRAPQDYEAAAKALTAALEDPAAKQDLAAAAQCRYQLAWCLFRLNRLEEAARAYEGSLPGLKATGSSDAVQAAWMAFVAYQSLAKSQPRFVSSAIGALNALQRDFPNHPYAKKADYYRGKLREGLASPEETLAELEKVPASSPNYLDARYDICALLHRQWREANAEGRARLAAKVLAAAEEFAKAARQDRDLARRVKCSLLAAEVALGSEPADPAKAQAFLDAAGPLVASLPAGSAVVAEYHYRRLQLAARAGDEAARQQHANWLINNAVGSPYEAPALVAAAGAVERALKSADAPQAAALRQEAYGIYRRLSELLGNSPAALQADRNARVASSKLAEYAVQLGRHAESAAVLDKLLEAFPTDQGYLRRAGLAHFQAGNFQRAIVPWGTLVEGLERGSEAWFEAKYYQLACLFRLDKAAARQALNQLKLLYPELGPSPWRKRFSSLGVEDR